MSSSKTLITVTIGLSIIFVVIGVVWLSVSTETLDEVAERFGAPESTMWTPPIPDYEIPGFEGNMATNILVGIAFTLIVLGVALVAGKALRSRGDPPLF